MKTNRTLYVLPLICLSMLACTIGVVQRHEVETVVAPTSSTPTLDPAAQATIGALSTQNAALSTQVAADAQPDPTETPTPTATATPVPTNRPAATKAPTPTPTPCTIAFGTAFQSPWLSFRPSSMFLPCARDWSHAHAWSSD